MCCIVLQYMYDCDAEHAESRKGAQAGALNAKIQAPLSAHSRGIVIKICGKFNCLEQKS